MQSGSPACPSDVCAACGGRRFITTSQGRKPCDCYWTILGEDIKPIIRHGEARLPATTTPPPEPWPLTSKTVTSGDYRTFRHQVWRSLLHHMAINDEFHFQSKYEYMDAGRLGEIAFRQDEEYPSYRGLIRPGLLVLVCGVADPPNKLVPHLVKAVTTLREMHGKPTWIYAPSPSVLVAPPLSMAERPVFGGAPVVQSAALMERRERRAQQYRAASREH